MQREAPPSADLSIPELLRQFSEDTTTLIRKEMELARAELSEKAKEAGKSAGLFGASAIFGVATFATLTITLIAALALVLPLWAAALIVTVAYGIVAAIAALTGRSSLKKVGSPVPERAVQSVTDDVTAVREAVRRGR